MKRTILIFLLAITATACASTPQATPTPRPTGPPPPLPTLSPLPPPTITPTSPPNILIAPSLAPALPTNARSVSDETYPTPTFSNTFTPLPPLDPDKPPFIANLYMMDASTGWAIEAGGRDMGNGGHLLHTVDGASTWQDVTLPQGAYVDKGFFCP